ncbi:MAG: 6-carboxytetrahydropterin synthase [Gemmatimonadetes bacterium]|nr:6-carboxytetrahydropterin synthase [Gemmatimonadota bacterium]
MRGATLTRRVRFSATHRYHRPEWTDAQNRAAFGACAAPEAHGHDYVCDITVGGDLDDSTGMVIDLGLLDRVLDEQVVRRLNGKLVNDAIDTFATGRSIPTCEAMARALAENIAAALATEGARARVASVRVAEDDSLSATWTTDL